MKKSSDEDIIARGPSPKPKELSDGNVSILALLAISAVVGGGFVVGAIIGASMAVAGSMGIAGFISGLATGGIWGGISGAGLIGAACGIGAVLDGRSEKKAKARDDAYHAAMLRRQAAEKIQKAAAIPAKGGAKNAFATTQAAPETVSKPVMKNTAVPQPLKPAA